MRLSITVLVVQSYFTMEFVQPPHDPVFGPLWPHTVLGGAAEVDQSLEDDLANLWEERLAQARPQTEG